MNETHFLETLILSIDVKLLYIWWGNSCISGICVNYNMSKIYMFISYWHIRRMKTSLSINWRSLLHIGLRCNGYLGLIIQVSLFSLFSYFSSCKNYCFCISSYYPNTNAMHHQNNQQYSQRRASELEMPPSNTFWKRCAYL